MKRISFEPEAWEQYLEWHTDRKKLAKLIALLKEVVRHPTEGTGKPERLKHQSHQVWSRRIDQEHRLVYQIEESGILILSCRGHYED